MNKREAKRRVFTVMAITLENDIIRGTGAVLADSCDDPDPQLAEAAREILEEFNRRAKRSSSRVWLAELVKRE